VKPGQVSTLFATALLEENARDEQLEAMRQMMIESRAIAEAAEQDYAFAEEAGSCATELALWGTLPGYHAKRVEDRWIVAGDRPALNGSFGLEGAFEWAVRPCPPITSAGQSSRRHLGFSWRSPGFNGGWLRLWA
jgi:hypothetical protein